MYNVDKEKPQLHPPVARQPNTIFSYLFLEAEKQEGWDSRFHFTYEDV